MKMSVDITFIIFNLSCSIRVRIILMIENKIFQDKLYLQPYIEEVKKEREEREKWDAS